MEKKNKQDFAGVVGDLDWKEFRDFLVINLALCKNEEDLGKIIMAIKKATGTKKELIKVRKEIKIKPFTKEELKKFM